MHDNASLATRYGPATGVQIQEEKLSSELDLNPATVAAQSVTCIAGMATQLLGLERSLLPVARLQIDDPR